MHTQPRASMSRSNLAHNYELLQKLASPGEVGAVVKANAFGHGAETVTQTLASIGCKTFFTATTDEAVSVRNAIGDKVPFSFSMGFQTRRPILPTKARAREITTLFYLIPFQGSTASVLRAGSSAKRISILPKVY